MIDPVMVLILAVYWLPISVVALLKQRSWLKEAEATHTRQKLLGYRDGEYHITHRLFIDQITTAMQWSSFFRGATIVGLLPPLIYVLVSLLKQELLLTCIGRMG
jgi:hypothetical protein